MSDRQTIKGELTKIKLLADKAMVVASEDRDKFAEMCFEIEKLKDIIDELRDENERLKRGES